MNKTKSLFLYLMVLIAWLGPAQVLACDKLGGNNLVRMAFDYTENRAWIFGKGKSGDTTRTFSGCDKKEKKYVKFSFAPEEVVHTTGRMDYHYDGVLKEKECKLKNLPFKRLSLQKRSENYLNRFKYMQSCLDILIKDESRRGIRFPGKQKNCKIEKIDKNTVKIVGAECYFTPSAKSLYKIITKPKADCANRDYLIKNKIFTRDALISVSLGVKDSMDENIARDYKKKALFNIRMVTEVSDLFESEEMYGGPRWPLSWINPDIGFGKIELDLIKNKLFVKTPLLVNHTCKEKCLDGLCSTPCDYYIPVAGEMNFYKIKKNGKKEWLGARVLGKIVPGNWQGILAFGSSNLMIKNAEELIKKGSEYVIEFIFGDPKIDYGILKKRYRSLFPRPNSLPGTFEGTRLDGLGNLNNNPAAGGVLSELPSFEDYTRGRNGSLNLGMVNEVERFEAIFGGKEWPPYYSHFCDRELKNCEKIGRKKYFYKLIAKFTAGDLKLKSEEDSFRGRKEHTYELKNLLIKKLGSHINQENKIKQEIQPKVECKK